MAPGATANFTYVTALTTGSATAAVQAEILNAADVAESTPGAYVGLVTANDPDPTDVLTLSVSDSRFEIVDGVLKLKATEALSHSAEPTVLVTITATDQAGLAYSEDFTLNVVPSAEPADSA